MVIVPTPSEPTGGLSLRYVLPACEAIGTAPRDKARLAQRGHHEQRHARLDRRVDSDGAGGGEAASAGIDFGLNYSTEFIALGSAIRAFLDPDFLLVGESDPHAGDKLSSIYETSAMSTPGRPDEFVDAALAKLSVNTSYGSGSSFRRRIWTP
jgi:UDPglucose 6-dehydrogenase